MVLVAVAAHRGWGRRPAQRSRTNSVVPFPVSMVREEVGLSPTVGPLNPGTPRPPKNFLKQVILVGPGVSSVPRGQAWQDLHDAGCIADVMEICGAWTEKQLLDALESAFVGILDQSTSPPRYLLL